MNADCRFCVKEKDGGDPGSDNAAIGSGDREQKTPDAELHPVEDDDVHTDHGPQKPRSWIRRKFIDPILHINGKPESVALGVASGMFLAMTPTVGIQMILVTILNTIIRANRLAGIIMVWISNPLTLIPIYWADYVVGSLMLNRTMITYDKFQEKMQVILEHVKESGIVTGFFDFVSFIGELAVPLFLGGVVVGLLCGLPLYPITLRAVKKHRARKEARRMKKLRKKGAGTDAGR